MTNTLPKKKYRLFLVLIIISFFYAFSTIKSFAVDFDVSSTEDWKSGSFSNTKLLDERIGIELESDGLWNAITIRTPDKGIGAGSAFTSDGTNIYVIRGLGDNLFWMYTPSTDTWKTLKNLPKGVYLGSDLQYLDGYIYAIFGGYQRTFARYSVQSNGWEILTDFPDLVYQGASMTTDGTSIYAISANSTQNFYKYSVSENTWNILNSTPATLRSGADLERVGDYIYTPRGLNTNTFYAYQISTNTWSTLATIPTNMNDDIDITSANGYIYIAIQNNTVFFYRYEIATNTWNVLPNAPMASRYAGVQYVSSENIIFYFRGNGDSRAWKFDITSQSFVGPNDAPSTLGLGSDMVYYNGAIYVVRGANTNLFYKYEISTNSWSTLAEALTQFNDDTRSYIVGSDIYIFSGGNNDDFYRYSITSNTWYELTSAPNNIRFGGAIAYPGTGNYLYVVRGGGFPDFWRYDISGGTWDTTLSNLPSPIIASYGSTLLSDGVDIYFTGGVGAKRMFKYVILTDTWQEVGPLPYSPYYGSDTSYDGNGNILGISGNYKSELWEYNILENIWRKKGEFAPVGPTEIGAWQGATVVCDGSGNTFISRGGGSSELLLYSKGDSNYKSVGTWYSPVYNLDYVGSWQSISVIDDTPLDSSIIVESRSSSDSISWSTWEGISDDNIVSPANKYLQFKVTLIPSTSGNETPSIQKITIQYTSDNQGPSDVEGAVAYSQELGGEKLEESKEYVHINPMFIWDESTDFETSVLGYHIYFGGDPNGNPLNEGFFQTSNSYVVNKGLSIGNNYLIIIAEDLIGNKSNPSTVYTYQYKGVGPFLSLDINDDELNGTLTNLQSIDDGVELENIEGGFWLEERLSLPLVNLGYGAKNIAYGDLCEKLFIPSGMNNRFFSYEIPTDTWTELANAPNTIYYGGGVVTGPEGYLYALRGNNSTDFWRYHIASDTWDTSVSNVPFTVGYGGSMIFDKERYIYVLRGNNSDNFLRYDTFSDTWEGLSKTDFGAPTSGITNNVYTGGSVAIDLERELIYAIQGNYMSGFSVYDINTDSWIVLPSTPMLPNQGGSITYYPSTNSVYFVNGNNTPNMFKYNVDEGEWEEVSQVPSDVRYGGGIFNVGDSIYAIRGGNTTGFYRYDIKKDSWLIPQTGIFGREYEASNLLNVSYGGDILKVEDDNFYITRGNYGDEFVKWNQKTGEVTKLANTPVGMYSGGSLSYDSVNKQIYLTGGIYDDGFFVYNIENNIWERDEDLLPVATSAGSSMVYDGLRYIYLNRGGATANFYRFDTQGLPGAKWSSLNNVSGTLYYGAELLIKEGYIYTLRGYNVNPNPFYRYNIDTGIWDSSLSSLTTNVYNDGFLVDGNNGNFYAARGGNTSEFYKYTLTNDTWTRLSDFPGQIYTGGSGESNMNNKIFVLSGSGTSTYRDAIYSYVIESENSGFEEEGVYESEVHDLLSVYKWGELFIKGDIFENTNILVETTSSQDGEDWSEWVSVSREREVNGGNMYKINSPTFRYFKVRIFINSGDGVSSPILKGYVVNYYQDIVKPTNPQSGGLQSKSSNEGTQIFSNTWYNYSTPYFEWAPEGDILGASDSINGSGVAGYYVYWGTSNSADPEEDGTLQYTNTFSPENLVDSEIYYLRIRTVDYAGNTSEEVWNPFIYKYDSSAPSKVTSLAADPAGYTAINSFSFSWGEATVVGSLIEEYCYKTEAVGVQTEEVCIAETSVNNITAQRVGPNNFSVRAKDGANNLGEYTTVQYFYVDAENAPAPPTNLQVSPTSNTENSFGFTWNPPLPGTYYGSQSNLSYMYSVNALPTEQSTSVTSLRYLNPGAYATLPGENVFYIVSRDEAGNVNYNDYASVIFSANTVAPGIPINLEIADVSVKSTSSWRLAISWDSPIEEGSGVAGYQVYRSINGEDYVFHSYTSGTSLVDSRLIQGTYYYKIKACDSTNNCGAMSEVVSLYPDGRYVEPASLIIDPLITDLTPKKATISWVTGRTSDSKVAYGLKSNEYFEEEVSNSEQVINHVLTINNLVPGTEYFYVVKWTDEDGNTGISEESSFTTLPPPSIKEPVVKSIGLNSALIQFTTKDAIKVRVLYGETPAFGGMKEVFTGTQEGTHNVELVDIKDGTRHYYKINTFDIDGSEYEGEMHSFETLPRPEISNVNIYQVSGTASATLLVEWNSNTPISSVVTYFPSSSREKALDEVNVALKSGKHRMVLLNLLPNTLYSVIVTGRDFMGNEASSGILNFTTAVDTRAPQIFDLEVSSEVIGTDQESSAQLVVSFKTDEAATSQVEFGEGTSTTYQQKSQEDTVLSNNHIIIISGLTPSKVYHLRGVSKDKEGNIGYSIDKVVVTSPPTEAAFNLAINNLVSIFSFLGKK